MKSDANTIKISNASKKKCRLFFGYKGIGKIINSATDLLENTDIGTIISEFLYDYDDSQLYNVLLYLIKENTSDKYANDLKKFDYIKIK